MEKEKVLKNYQSQDLHACVDLYVEIFTSEPFNYQWMEKEKIIRYFDDLLHTPKFRGFVYYEGETLLGACLGVRSDYFDTIQYEIKEIFVAQSLQRKSIGSQMLSAIEQRLQVEGIQLITLLCSIRTAAFDFYVKNAYTQNFHTIHFYKALQ